VRASCLWIVYASAIVALLARQRLLRHVVVGEVVLMIAPPLPMCGTPAFST
jgi:hypothetical protein